MKSGGDGGGGGGSGGGGGGGGGVGGVCVWLWSTVKIMGFCRVTKALNNYLE